jgi:hypothetical protein
VSSSPGQRALVFPSIQHGMFNHIPASRTGGARLIAIVLAACVAAGAIGLYRLRRPATRPEGALDWPNPDGAKCTTMKPCFARWTGDGDGALMTQAALITPADSLAQLSNKRLPPLARDSITLITVVTQSCATCAAKLSELRALKAWAALQGVAMHVVAPTPGDASALAKSAADSALISIASPDLVTRLGVSRFPATVFVDVRGVVRRRVQEKLPTANDILSAANENTGWAGFGGWRAQN